MNFSSWREKDSQGKNKRIIVINYNVEIVGEEYEREGEFYKNPWNYTIVQGKSSKEISTWTQQFVYIILLIKANGKVERHGIASL